MYKYILDLRVGDIVTLDDKRVEVESVVILPDNDVMVNNHGPYFGEDQVRVSS